MRTSNFFKSIVTVTLVAVVSMGAFGQALTNSKNYTQIGGTGVNGSFVDTVGLSATPYTDYYEYATVGSTMPYAVRKDVNVNKLIASNIFKPSVFFLNINTSGAWGTSTRTTGSWTLTDTTGNPLHLATAASGANILAAQEAFPYALDTVYAVNWKTAGTSKIWTYEWPVSNTPGLTSCIGDSSSLTVNVVDKPFVDWTNDLAFSGASAWVLSTCGGGTTTLNVNYNGYGNVVVKYDSALYSLSGVQDLAHTGSNTKTFTNASFALPVLQSAKPLTNWNPAGTYGYVVYTIDYVNDLISRKSLTRAAGGLFLSVASAVGADPSLAADITAASANMPSHTFKVYSLPTPSARPIKHIQNTGW